MKIATAQLWVHDQDEALDFYTGKLGMEVRQDVTVPELGNFRWLTVAPAGRAVLEKTAREPAPSVAPDHADDRR